MSQFDHLAVAPVCCHFERRRASNLGGGRCRDALRFLFRDDGRPFCCCDNALVVRRSTNIFRFDVYSGVSSRSLVLGSTPIRLSRRLSPLYQGKSRCLSLAFSRALISTLEIYVFTVAPDVVEFVLGENCMCSSIRVYFYQSLR